MKCYSQLNGNTTTIAKQQINFFSVMEGNYVFLLIYYVVKITLHNNKFEIDTTYFDYNLNEKLICTASVRNPDIRKPNLFKIRMQICL